MPRIPGSQTPHLLPTLKAEQALNNSKSDRRAWAEQLNRQHQPLRVLGTPAPELQPLSLSRAPASRDSVQAAAPEGTLSEMSWEETWI